MNLFKLRIVRVDMNGYCGREHHPHPSDIGLVVTPLRMEVWHSDPDNGYMNPTVDNGGEIIRADHAKDEDNQTALWVALTADGRTLDLIDDEIQIVSVQEG